MGESWQLSFDSYQAEYTPDAGGAMLDRAALAAVEGVKVRMGGRGGAAQHQQNSSAWWRTAQGQRLGGLPGCGWVAVLLRGSRLGPI